MRTMAALLPDGRLTLLAIAAVSAAGRRLLCEPTRSYIRTNFKATIDRPAGSAHGSWISCTDSAPPVAAAALLQLEGLVEWRTKLHGLSLWPRAFAGFCCGINLARTSGRSPDEGGPQAKDKVCAVRTGGRAGPGQSSRRTTDVGTSDHLSQLDRLG